MAKWVVQENRRGNLSLTYKNLLSGQVFECGELRRDTPADMILKWIVKEGGPNPGDLIRFPDGTILQVHGGQASA